MKRLLLILTFSLLSSFLLKSQVVNVPLTFDNFNKIYCGTWEETINGLKINGTAYRVGNFITTKNSYNFSNSEVYVKWKAHSGTFGYFPLYISNVLWAGFFTTAWSWNGSIVISQDIWYYTRFKINLDHTYTAVTATNNYDNNGGTLFYSRSDSIPLLYWPFIQTGTVHIGADDTYGGTDVNFELGELQVVDAPIQIISGVNCDTLYTFENDEIPANFYLTGNWLIANTGYLSNKSLYINSYGNSSFSININRAKRVSFDVRVLQGSSSYPFKDVSFMCDEVQMIHSDKSSVGCWVHHEVTLPPEQNHEIKWEIPSDPYSTNLEAWIDNLEIIYDDIDFSAVPTTGDQPLTSHFTDKSCKNYNSWKWDFNSDGIIESQEKNPTYTFYQPGIYSVRMIGYNSGSSDTVYKTEYITVNNSAGAVVHLVGNLSFGSVVVNHNANLFFTIYNTSSMDIIVSSITYPNGFTGNWSGGVITAGNSKTVMVTFSPTGVQTYSGLVTVHSNAGSGTNDILITGNGVQNTNGLNVSGNLDFGTVSQGSMNDKPVFLHNNTSSVITINNITPLPTGAFSSLMQNGSTILPNQSLPVSIYFFPTDILTYSTTFIVTSDAPNGNVTFTATGISGSNPISWIGFYTKPENNPEINQDTLDEHYINQGARSPIKICADGSKATTVKFINNDPGVTTNNIIFNMMSDPFGNNTDFTGLFVTPDYTYNGNTVAAKFTHPKYLNISELYRSDNLQVVNSVNGNIIYSQPVEIYRAPVVLVHGLWGDFPGMLTIRNGLLNSGKYDRSLLRIADYSTTNASSFSTNSNLIKDEINKIIQRLHLSKYSVGKVDIVAHSMGGILSRIYIQNDDCANGIESNCYRGDIHKLLTLNTPHSGTQIANFLLSNAQGAGLAQWILARVGKQCNEGGVNDLQCNSPAIASLNGSSLNNHIVPCHAIQTESSVEVFSDLDENALTIITAAARGQSGEEFNNQVFAYTPNDLVVPTNSQKGGLNDFSFETGVMHTGSPANNSVISTVKLLLDENPVNSVYFDQNMGGFNPPQILPTFSPSASPPIGGPVYSILPNVGVGIVDITSPSPGFTCSEGDTVQIHVSCASNVNHLLVMITNKNSGSRLFDTLVNSATFFYRVPNNTAGLIKITAMGYDAIGFVGSDTLDVFSTPASPLDSLTFFTDNFYIEQGQSVSITIFGYFNDSTLRNISQLSNIVYDVANPNIASWNTGNVIQGLAIGTTVLHASYQNKHVYSLVTVYSLTQQLENITIPNGSTTCYNATQEITVAGSGTEFTVENGGSVTMIAGQNIIYLPNTTVQSGGYMWGYIAPSGPYCMSPSMPEVLTNHEEPSIGIEISYFKVYPNPTTGNFVLELNGDISVDKVTVDVYEIRGEKVLTKVLIGERKHEFSLSDRPAGIYFIRVITANKSETAKIIKH